MELFDEYIKHIDEVKEFFHYLYNEEFFPSVSNFVLKIQEIKNDNVTKYFKENNLKPLGNEWFEKYFYALMKGIAYWYEFADLHLKDIKDMIKANYSECLSQTAMKWFSMTFSKRYKYIPIECLQEYSGKNRGRETIKKENKLISDKEVYYLYKHIDDLYNQFGYDKIDTLMGTKILNIRGTNGSGKTTMVKNLIKKFNEVEESVWDEFTTEEITTYHKVYTRKAQIWHKQKVLVMGIYNEKQTGGVDNYDTPWQIMYGLFYFCKKYQGYTIILEGIRVSTNYVYWYKMFNILRDKGVIVKIVGLLPSDIDWAVNNVKERRKDKNIWDLRHAEDIATNNYDIFRGIMLFLSQGFQSCIISPDKFDTIEDEVNTLRYML